LKKYKKNIRGWGEPLPKRTTSNQVISSLKTKKYELKKNLFGKPQKPRSPEEKPSILELIDIYLRIIR
jgi:hypothetical protein